MRPKVFRTRKMVGAKGLEPIHLAAQVSKTCMSAIPSHAHIEKNKNNYTDITSTVKTFSYFSSTTILLFPYLPKFLFEYM